MKRSILFLVVVLLCATLVSCGRNSAPTAYVKDGYTVDLRAGIITKGEDIYTFEISGNGTRSRIEIHYPNGGMYFWEWRENSGHGGWNNDYDPVRYPDGDTLMDLISYEPPTEKRDGNPVLGLVLIVLGLADTISPKAAWYLGYGWRFKDAEPSEAALVFGRLSGIFCVILGLFLLFSSILNAA